MCGSEFRREGYPELRALKGDGAFGNHTGNHFARCSKSVVLNLMLLENISPALNGRFFAHMKNGERLMISRQYAQKMKQIVMGGGRDED